MIRAKVGDDGLSVLQSVLTNVRGINKTDVLTLSTRYHVSYPQKESRLTCRPSVILFMNRQKICSCYQAWVTQRHVT